MYWSAVYRDKVFLDTLTAEPQGTKAVAEKIGCDYNTALNNLRRLAKVGKVESAKVNSNAWAWWKK